MDNVFLLSEFYNDIELHAGKHGKFGQDLVYTSLAKTSHGELVEGFLTEGQVLTMMPASQYDGMIDVFFFIEGNLIMHAGKHSRRIHPQTLISSDSFDISIKIEARAKTRYLHFQAPPWLKKNDNEGQIIKQAHSSFEFVFSRGSIELMLGKIEAGNRMFAIPEEEEAIEVYYVVDGLFTLEQDSKPLLKSGDYFIARGLSQTKSCFANTDVSYIYFSNLAKKQGVEEFHKDLIKLASEVEKKDGYTSDHCKRLQRLSVKTGMLLGLDSERMLRLTMGALLHDLGKVKVPIEILQKPGKLTAEEWNIIKEHPTAGQKMLQGTELEKAAIVVEQHHERLDGSGYPYGLSDDSILTESYIVAVADTFDAMTTDRPYRKALTTEAALEEIKALADKQIPKEVIDAFIEANGDE